MSVIRVQETGDTNSRGGFDETFTRAYTRVFRVTTDTPSDGPQTIFLDSRLPQYGEVYVRGNDNDPTARVSNCFPERIDPGGMLWRVTVDYTRFAPIPWGSPPTIGWDSETILEPALFDRDGNPIVNSAQCLFDPPLEAEVAIGIVRIDGSTQSFNPQAVLQYVNATNSDAWLGGSPGQWKCTKLSATQQTQGSQSGDQTYFQCSFEAKYRVDGWAKRALNMGFTELVAIIDGTTGKTTGYRQIAIRDDFGEPINEPVFLNSSGAKLLPADLLAITNGSYDMSTLVKTFDLAKQVPFGALNLLPSSNPLYNIPPQAQQGQFSAGNPSLFAQV